MDHRAVVNQDQHAVPTAAVRGYRRIKPLRVAAIVAAAALFGCAVVAPGLIADQSTQAARPAPSVKVTFDPTSGLPSRYVVPSADGATMRGQDADPTMNDGRNVPTATWRATDLTEYNGARSLVFNHIQRVSDTSTRVFYDSFWSDGKTKVGTVVLQYDTTAWTVSVTLGAVSENPGFQLISVNTESLISVGQTDGGQPWLLDANGGGMLNTLAAAKTGRIGSDDPYYFGNKPNLRFYPVEAMGTSHLSAAVEIQGVMSSTAFAVYGDGSAKRATIGASTQYRVRGTATTPNLLMNQPQVARITFADDYDHSGQVDWMDVAKRMRDTQAPAIPSHYYDDKYVYQVQDHVGRHPIVNTFADNEKLAARIANIIDGNPQVQFVAGTITGGHDTVEPSYEPIDPQLGGLEGWKTLQANAAKLSNTNVTTDDNYDDQYDNEFSRPNFDPAYIAHNADNSLMTFNAWNGVDTSYITGMKKYMVDGGPGLARIKGTVEGHSLKSATLVDGMSWWSVRNDWDPAHPASAYDNLVDGKYKLIDAYAKQGVAVASELQTYPFIGKLALVVDGPESGGWVGGTPVPFMSLVLRHSMIYGGGYQRAIPNMGRDVDPKVMLINNNRSSRWFSAGQPEADTDIADQYYLVYRPWMLLSKLDIDTFTRSADGTTVHETLSDKAGHTATIDIDYATNTFSAVYDGKQIMRGYSVTVPVDTNRIAYYSRTAQTMSYTVDRAIAPKKVKAVALKDGARTDVPVTVSKSGEITVDVPAGVPVMVYLDGKTGATPVTTP